MFDQARRQFHDSGFRMTERHALPSRIAMSLVTGLLVALVPASATFADAPGPTDYRSTVTSVETKDGLPLPEGVNISIEGHDSFLALTVPRGVAAEVPGYELEPYLNIDQDCTASENQHSMSTWYNKDRFGGDASTDLVDNDADPDWKIIGSSCSVAWHDHRIHYMSSIPPINAEPGDVIVTDSIALTIDGRDVVVHVESELIAPASQLPAIVGAIVALAILAAMWKRMTLTLLVFPVSAIGLIIGGAQYLWAPAETGPNISVVALPFIATAAGVAAYVARQQGLLFTNGSVLLSGTMLTMWAILRTDVFSYALLPTSLPYWVDRSATAVVAVSGIAFVSSSMQQLWRMSIVRPQTELATD